MGTSMLQPSFTGGEISPSLYARVDLARYGTSLRTCRNFIVQRHGGVVSRPGFRYVGALAGAAQRLVEFSLGPDDSLLVEFSNVSIRFFRGGALVSAWTFPSSPYTAAQVVGIQVAQVGMEMVVTHPEVAPQLLRFLGTGFSFGPSLFAPSLALTPPAPGVTPFDSSTPAKPHAYVVTSVDNLTGEESFMSLATTVTMNLTPDKPATIVTALSSANIYRGRNGVFGYIGTTETGTFLDEAIPPDYSSPPPAWNNPFAAPGEYPAVCTHFQQRRWFAGMRGAPQTLRASRASELRRFDAASPARDDDTIDVTLAATQGQAVLHMVPLNRLIVMTSRAEWSASAGNDAVLTPNNTGFQAESAYGASIVPPVLTGDGAVYVQAQGTRVRDLVFNPQIAQFGGTDLTVLASHLFEGFTITGLAWSSYPFSCVWAVRNDGVLLALTYLRDQEVWGWSQHATDGFVDTICVVREGQSERLYAIVRRTVNGAEVRMLEALTERFGHDPLQHVGLDSSLSYDGRNVDPAKTVVLLGPSFERGASVTAAFAGVEPAGLSVGDELHLQNVDGTRAITALVLAVTSPSQCTVRVDRDVPAELRGVATSRWALAQAVFTGLSHLVGREVVAVVDGAVQPNLTVQPGGAVALRYPGSVVHVGLPYTCTLETLDLSMPQRGTIRDRAKTISRVTLYVEQTRGLTVQTIPGDPVPVKQRELERYEDGIAPFTGTFEVRTPATWDTPGRVRVEQTYPLPATVLAIIPEVTVGG